MSKPLDVIVFGATSFVGQILVKHLWERHGISGEIRWGMAGRSRDKLEMVRASLGGEAESLPLVIADSADIPSLEALCRQANVVVSTVGPYALYGSELVRLCAETGTDYCDLTGEVQWISRMIRAHEATAKRTVARIVHCCGFDSIPSDLGMRFLQAQAQAKLGAPLTTVNMRVRKLAGGMSGGTVASLVNVFKELSESPSLAKDLANPYLLCAENPRIRQDNVQRPTRDTVSPSWLAPFLMAPINTRVVLRSNELSGWAWGRDLRYDEAMMTGTGVKGLATASALTAGLGGLAVGAAIGPVRRLLESSVLPKPGEGPSPAEQASGHFDLRFFGRSEDGRTLNARVTGERDPGYGATGRMLGEAAVSLAKDVNGRPGGFWTPASLMGEALEQRLVAHAGMTFTLFD